MNNTQRPSRFRARGATMTEYAMVLFAVLVVAATVFRSMGTKVMGGAADTSSKLN